MRSFAMAMILCCVSAEAAEPFVVADQGKALVTVVTARDAPPSVAYAAEELRRFLGEMTGAEIPLAHAPSEVGTPRVIDIGNVFRALMDEGAPYGIEEYRLATVDNTLVISGGLPRGVLYGVYGLLEEHLGCRWFTPEVSRIPKNPRLEIPTLDERVKPVLEYREPFVMDCYDGDWSARNRMNGTRATLEPRHGGKVTYQGFVHTFNELLPPETHFAEHPEYFALVGGKRLGERTQLCCTNPDVMRIVTEGIRQRMRDNPDTMVYSVSQNDWYNYCTCDTCSAVAKAEESEIGPVLALVNHVAREVHDEFPDKVVDTLAYQWTRKPPKTMRPEPNVVVRLCSIECCFAHPLEKCSSEANRQFVKDAEAWKALGARLWVWDYVTSFSHYLVPFPNLHVRQPNIRFFVEHGVTGIFEQDVYQTPHGEFSALSGYLNAKLLWEPGYDPDVAIDEFLDAVYGEAAPMLRDYLGLIHAETQDRDMHMDIWVGPEGKHLNDPMLAKGEALFEKAEAAVASDPAVLERVKIARLSLDYAIIERTRNQQGTQYDVDHAAYTVRVQPDFQNRVNRFFGTAERSGFLTIREHLGELATYKGTFAKQAPDRVLTPRAGEALERPARGLRYAYYEGDFEKGMPDLTTLTPVKEGTATRVGLRSFMNEDGIALKYTGYFHAPANGVYTFSTSSNDGSQLLLGGEMLVDNGGPHKLQTVSGAVGLLAGYHPIEITYFESGGEEALDVHVEGPGIARQPLAAKMLWHVK